MQIQFLMMAIFYDSVIRLIDNIPLFMSYLSKEPGVYHKNIISNMIVVLELSPLVSPFVYILNMNLACGNDRSVFLVNS